jgi:hypothetical protein
MITAALIRRISKSTARRILPQQRPMDNMKMGWERPQEDEFALVNMGVPSTYEIFLFPKEQMNFPTPIDPDEFKERDRLLWQSNFLQFLKRIALQRRREQAASRWDWLVLKSPMHTARIGYLHRLFPKARFIHLVRDPYEMFSSNMLMLQAMIASQSCQDLPEDTDTLEKIEGEVLERLNRIYRNFESDIQSLPAGQFFELRYEDLTRRPIEVLQTIYRELQLGSFDANEPALREYVTSISGYQRNQHQIDVITAAKVRSAWSWYFDRFNY